MRKVILHYHLFKNAGSSLDAAFKENFDVAKSEWVTKEFPAQPMQNREKVIQWIIDNPQATCFSSHTAILPPPQIDGVMIIPVIFIRHPIDRIASVYSFENTQKDEGFGTTLARNTTLAGYIETRLSIRADRQCRDFHAHRLANMFGDKQGDEATRAKMAIEKLPFVGVVEKYSESLSTLEALLEKEGFVGVKLKPIEKNVSRGLKKSLDEKLIEIEEQLGTVLFSKLLGANRIDLLIYNMLVKPGNKQNE